MDQLLTADQALIGLWVQPPHSFSLYIYTLGLHLHYLCKALVSRCPSSRSLLGMTSTALAYLPSHYITVTQIQYILIISIAWEFATN